MNTQRTITDPHTGSTIAVYYAYSNTVIDSYGRTYDVYTYSDAILTLREKETGSESDMTDPNTESLDFKRGWGVGYQEACEDLASPPLDSSSSSSMFSRLRRTCGTLNSKICRATKQASQAQKIRYEGTDR